MAEAVEESKKISPYMVMFLVHPIQIGVGILAFQHDIIGYAGYDAWISLLFAGFGVHLVLWILYSVMNRADGNLIKVHRDVFGKWAGGVVSFVFIVYFFSESVLVLRSYAEIVQVWIFPQLGTWFISLLLLFLAYYAISGGFRVVVGVCFFGFLIPFIGVSWVFFWVLPYTNFQSFLPIWNHPLGDILLGTKQMMLSYLGFESLLIAYPFIQKPRSSQKWAHVSNLFTIAVYLFIAVVTFAYFSEELLKNTLWPTLSMVNIVELPFLERFEYFFICLWLLTILPNIVVTLWASTRGAKELFKAKQKYVLIVAVAIAFITTLFFRDRAEIKQLNTLVPMTGFCFLYMYMPVLWLIQFIKSKVRKKAS